MVVAGGRESCAPGYTISRKTFPYYAVEFITRGRGKLILNNNIWDLKPGTVFFYKPGIPHDIWNDTEEPIEKYFLNITGEKTVELLDKELSLSGKIFYTSASHPLIQTFEELIQYGLDSSTWCDKICSSLFEVLIYKIARYAFTKIAINSSSFTTFLRCRSYIATHYREFRSLNSLADSCEVTSSYLCRLFKKFENKSPYQYLINLQMNYAADRILKENLSIHSIAEQMGYKDPQHFTRTFKRVKGVSPAEFVGRSVNKTL